MDAINYSELIACALDARKKAYVPYSGFAVGAALLTKDGRIYSGANIENAAYSPTNCAERTAFFTAVSEGEREFLALAVVGDKKESDIPEKICTPCGVCRQVMLEFCAPDEFIVIMARDENDFITKTLSEIMPYSFTPKDLQ